MERINEFDEMMGELEAVPFEMTQISPKTILRARRRKVLKYTVMPSGLLAVMLVMVTVVLNISPPVAYAFERMPVLRNVASIFVFSPSGGVVDEAYHPPIQEVVEQGLVQGIEMEQTVDGITMRIERVVVMPREVRIYYMLEGLPEIDRPYAVLRDWVELLCVEYEAYFRITMGHSLYCVVTGREGRITAYFHDMPIPERMILTLNVEVYRSVPEGGMQRVNVTPFCFEIELDAVFVQKGEVVYVNREFEIGGQTLVLTLVEIYASEMTVHLRASRDNTARLIDAVVYAKDELGNRFDMMFGGFRNYPFPDEVEVVMETPFFAESDELTLFIDGAMWLDENAPMVRVDIIGQTAENLPERVEFIEAARRGELLDVWFEELVWIDGMNRPHFGWQFFDPWGNEHELALVSGEHGAGGNCERAVRRYVLRYYPYDYVYFVPAHSHLTVLDEPLALRVR